MNYFVYRMDVMTTGKQESETPIVGYLLVDSEGKMEGILHPDESKSSMRLCQGKISPEGITLDIYSLLNFKQLRYDLTLTELNTFTGPVSLVTSLENNQLGTSTCLFIRMTEKADDIIKETLGEINRFKKGTERSSAPWKNGVLQFTNRTLERRKPNEQAKILHLDFNPDAKDVA